MNATTFDSLAAARKLREAGMEQGPAEAIAGLLHKVAVANREDLITKADLLVTKAKLDAFEARLRTAIRTELAFGFNRMTLNMIVALVVLFVALKLF